MSFIIVVYEVNIYIYTCTVKIKISKAMVKPVAVYVSETWTLTEMDMNRLGTRHRKVLRRIYGPVEEQGIWRKRTDQELRELYENLDRVADIKKKNSNGLDM